MCVHLSIEAAHTSIFICNKSIEKDVTQCAMCASVLSLHLDQIGRDVSVCVCVCVCACLCVREIQYQFA